MTFKSILSRLLSLGEKEAEKKRQAPLEEWREKRRSNRVPFEGNENIYIRLLNPESKETAATLVGKVFNISLRGCRLAFFSSDETIAVRISQELVATLEVEDYNIPLKVEVVRKINEKEVAIQFKAPFPRELIRLEKFLEPRCLGMSLREIKTEALQEGDKSFRWFQGDNETNLFSWVNPETQEIVQQQLVFLENVVEWRTGTKIKTGRVKEDASSLTGKIGWVKSELLEFKNEIDKNLLEQAQVLMESAQIDKKIKKAFITGVQTKIV